LYGGFICVVFIYTQREREQLDQAIAEQKSTIGCAKARYLGLDLDEKLQSKLLADGICSDEILKINAYLPPQSNTFHSEEKRRIREIKIPMKRMPKGRDLDWMYGFNKHQVEKGIALNPYDKAFFLAMKYFYEPDELSQKELDSIMSEDIWLNEDVEMSYLEILEMREELTEAQDSRYTELIQQQIERRRLKLDEHLKKSGSSWKKLLKENPQQASFLLQFVCRFNDKTLNVLGSPTIYLDINGVLHVYLRHAVEFQVNNQFEHKDNFQWNLKAIMMVMEKIVQKHEEEIQFALNENPGQRYSKYGDHSIYFEGDYYTFHIESDGRVSTFHKNRKKKD